MAVQGRANITNVAFIRMGSGLTKEAETVLQDAGRSGNMVYGTLMSRVGSSGKWVPFTDETATDGSQIPKGVLLKTLTEAEIQAADVANVPILVRGEIIDQNQLTIENSKTLATIVNVPTNLNSSVEEIMRWTGIFVEDTIDVDSFEN